MCITTRLCEGDPVPSFQKRAAMGITLGHPISNDVVDVIRYEAGMTVAPPVSWGFKAADCNYR